MMMLGNFFFWNGFIAALTVLSPFLTFNKTTSRGVSIPQTYICKKFLSSCKIEKKDFPKLYQDKGLGELVLKIYVLDRLDLHLFSCNYFVILHFGEKELG